MNYSDIIAALDQATGFDLFRIKTAIGHMLDNPNLIKSVKRLIKPDQIIEYFEPTENRAVKATVIKINRTKVSVKNIDDGTQWVIPYYFINIHGIETGITLSKNLTGLNKNEISVGDIVGFYDHRDQSEVYGRIIRLNQKTVSLDASNGSKWRVSYGSLFQVLTPNLESLPNIPYEEKVD